MAEIAIEKVGENNFDIYLDLLEKMAKSQDFAPPNDKARERLKNDALDTNPKYEAFLAEKDSEVVGLLIIYQTYSTFLALPSIFIEDIFVVENQRRKGIAQKMFDFCVSLAKERNCGRIEWWTKEWNNAARKFYKKNKAKKVDCVFFRMTEEDIDAHLKKL